MPSIVYTLQANTQAPMGLENICLKINTDIPSFQFNFNFHNWVKNEALEGFSEDYLSKFFSTDILQTRQEQDQSITLTVYSIQEFTRAITLLANTGAYHQLPELQAYTEDLYDNQQEKIHFQQGPRTAAHHGGIKRLTITHNNTQYECLHGAIDFVALQTPQVASVGTRREIITMDCQASEMAKLYEEFAEQLPQNPNKAQLFNTVLQFTQRKIPIKKYEDKDYPKKSEIYYGDIKTQESVVSLAEIVKGGKGVCRHFALFTAFLLGQYYKNHPENNTSVHHCRDNIPFGAHTWVVLKQKDHLYIIDPMWNTYCTITDKQGYISACNKYGQETIDRTLQRASLPSPAVSQDDFLAEELDRKSYARFRIIKKLLEQGASIKTRGRTSGWTVADVVASQGNHNDFDWLIQSGLTLEDLMELIKGTDAGTARIKRALEKQPQIRAGNEQPASATVPPAAEDRQITPATLNQKLRNELELGKESNPQVIINLLEAGAKQTVKSRQGWTIAHVAAYSGNQKLLAMIPDNSHLLNSQSSLPPVCMSKTSEILEAFITKGADLKLRYSSHSGFKQLTVADYLINQAGWKPEILLAISLKQNQPNPETVKYLLKFNPELANTAGLGIPLYRKLIQLNIFQPQELVDYIKQHYSENAQAVVHIIQEEFKPQPTPLQELQTELDKKTNADPKVILALLKKQVDINTVGETGWTVAHVAASLNNTELFERIPANSPLFDSKIANSGFTPVCLTTDPQMAQKFIERGVDLTAEIKMPNNQKLPIYQFLIARKQTCTPEFIFDRLYTSKKLNRDALEFLITRGADLSQSAEIAGQTRHKQRFQIAIDQKIITASELVELLLDIKTTDEDTLKYQTIKQIYTENPGLIPLGRKKEVLLAVQKGDTFFLKELQNRANQNNSSILDACSDSNEGPLCFAKTAPVIQYLREIGAALTQPVKDLLNQSLREAKSFAVAKEWIEAGAEYTVCDPDNKLLYDKLLNEQMPSQSERNRLRSFLQQREINQAIDEIEPEQFDITVYKNLAGNAGTEDIPTPNQQVLILLFQHVQEQINRLHKSKIKNGKLDKITLYRELLIDLHTALKSANDISPINMENFINRTATISHHRRRRTRDRFFGLGLIEAASWTAYKTMVDAFLEKEVGLGADLVNALEGSKTASLLCQVKNGTFVEGYEEYRKESLDPNP
ncbi:transglutaminase-like domain-containing protein [Legionella dresdenensis]|uniref:Transglutaminase-like domain-containing protein n=1 Tax=Legionella dresdenensis TaxID=450200 RepID=A0ABV8CHB9_9GAMM